MVPRNFVVLNNQNLAIVRSSPGVSKIAFRQSDISQDQTVTFATTDPCVAVIDANNTQWDLDSKRVWYTPDQTTINLADILYAKGLVTEPAVISTLAGAYTREKTRDSASGYCWANPELTPSYLYTKTEPPAVGDAAYYADTTEGASVEITGFTSAVVQPIGDVSTEWEAVFIVSSPVTGSTITGITYDIIS